MTNKIVNVNADSTSNSNNKNVAKTNANACKESYSDTYKWMTYLRVRHGEKVDKIAKTYRLPVNVIESWISELDDRLETLREETVDTESCKTCEFEKENLAPVAPEQSQASPNDERWSFTVPATPPIHPSTPKFVEQQQNYLNKERRRSIGVPDDSPKSSRFNVICYSANITTISPVQHIRQNQRYRPYDKSAAYSPRQRVALSLENQLYQSSG